MKLITKFLSSSTLVFCLTTGLISGSTIVFNRAERSIEAHREQTQYTIDKVLNLQINLANQVEALKDYLFLDQDPVDLTRYQQAMSEFTISLEEVQYFLPEVEEIAVIQRRHQNLVRLARGLNENPGSFSEIQQDIRALNSFSRDIELYLQSLASTTKNRNRIVLKEARNLQKYSRLTQYLIILILLSIFVIQFRFIFIPVIHSIEKLKYGAHQIGRGDFNHDLNIQSNDEIQELAEDFNQMALKLAESHQQLANKLQELTQLNQNLTDEIENRHQAEAALQKTLEQLQKTQFHLIQTEKMSSLGQMVAGIAHEINNPVNFIHANVTYAKNYTEDLLNLMALYQKHYPDPVPEIQEELEAVDLDFIVDDFYKLLQSMRVGTERIQEIVQSLRTFSRLDEAELKRVDIHEGLDGSLLILQHRLKDKANYPAIQVLKDYQDLPLVSCYSGQLNQVFLNILSNAIDALEEHNQAHTVEEIQRDPHQIWIKTETNFEKTSAMIRIKDNGSGIPAEVISKLFDPFFTTKPIGKGTGLGLAISYQIITERHQGTITCHSEPGKGTEFMIEIPINQTHSPKNQNINLAYSLVS